jgi:hypothetical protein
MYAISLTSIPPRYARLGPVLESILAQRPAPDRVILSLPERHARFAPAALPALPGGVDVLRVPHDEGPATKVLPAARALAGQVDRLIYCDDDWLMPPDWAARLLCAQSDREAVAASGFDVSRFKRRSHCAADPGRADIAQGFAGVAVCPDWFAGPGQSPPPAAWPVDDLWLSAQLAHQGIPIRLVPTAREGALPAYADDHALQSAIIGGRDRNAANLACLDMLTARFGLWPPLDSGLSVTRVSPGSHGPSCDPV